MKPRFASVERSRRWEIELSGETDGASPKRVPCGPRLAGFIAARDRVRTGYGAHRAEKPEGVACLEHADGQNPDALDLLRTRLLPQPDQCLLENTLGGE